jgi:membrane-associated phospholipid phosphatase
MVALLLWLNAPLQGVPRHALLLLAPACMFARVYFGAHWIGDTIGGAAIGAFVMLVYQYLFGGMLA